MLAPFLRVFSSNIVTKQSEVSGTTAPAGLWSMHARGAKYWPPARPSLTLAQALA